MKAVVCHNLAILDEPEVVRLTRYPFLSKILRPILPFAANLLPEFQVPISMYLDLKQEELKVFGDAKKFIEQDPLALKYISLKAMASLSSTPLSTNIREIIKPVMVIHAEKDNIFPRDYIERIFSLLPGPKYLKILWGRSHLVLHNDVDEIVPEVDKWLKDNLDGK